MGRADPLVIKDPTKRLADVDTRLAVRERNSPISLSVAGNVADATTTVKGKLKLAGHLTGTADSPALAAWVYASTTNMRLQRLGYGVDPTSSNHQLYVMAGAVENGITWSNFSDGFFNQRSSINVQREHLTPLVGTTVRNIRSWISSDAASGSLTGEWATGVDIQCRDKSTVGEFDITSITSAGVVTVSLPGRPDGFASAHPFTAGKRVLIHDSENHNHKWIVAASPAPTATTFALAQDTGGPAVPATTSSTGIVTNAPAMAPLLITVHSRVDRTIKSGGALLLDGLGGMAVKNDGVARATEPF
jgi:hypothetical protein